MKFFKLSKRANDLTNKVFGDLTAIEVVGKDSGRHNIWQCDCTCGNKIDVCSSLLVNGTKTNCGKCDVKAQVLRVREEQIDLFLVPSYYFLAHGISGDFEDKTKIWSLFNQYYNLKEKLVKVCMYDFPDVGDVVKIDNVFNLVIKELAHDKLNIDDLKKSLEDLKICLMYTDVKYLAIPKIGCGNNKLDWDVVKPMIIDVLKDVDMELLICYQD